MPHLFSHDYIGYPPLETIRGLHIDIWPSLVKEIKNFHSEHGMSIALEKFGLGQSVRFEDARPGDIISFDRDWVGGGPGHSAIFLAFLTRDQKEIPKYKPGEIVGFKYFSAQKSKPAGLGERWAYFKVDDSKKNSIEFCPYSEVPPSTTRCLDANVTEANKKRFPSLVDRTHLRDCCVVRSGTDGPRVGRLLAPRYWTYAAKQKEVQKEENELKEDVRQFMESESRGGERLRLFAIGALVLEKSNPKAAADYIKQVQQRFNVDLRSIAQAASAPGVNLSVLYGFR